MESRKFFWFLIILALLIGIGVLVATNFRSRPASPPLANTQNANKIVKRDIDPAKLPDQFPADLPFEAGAQVTQNYTATTPAGKFQSTRVLTTAKTLDQNLKLWTDYFNNHGYKLENTLNQPSIKAVAAAKGSIQVSATFSQSQDGKRTIDVTITQAPPKQ